MIGLLLKAKRLREEVEELQKQKIELQSEVEAIVDKQLVQRGVELKETLTKAGIYTVNRINRNLTEGYVMMYGFRDGRLIKAEMGRLGYLLLSYVSEE